MTSEWFPLETFPKDGTRCDIRLAQGAIAYNITWSRHPRTGRMGFVGQEQALSTFAIEQAISWRPAKYEPAHIKAQKPVEEDENETVATGVQKHEPTEIERPHEEAQVEEGRDERPHRPRRNQE